MARRAGARAALVLTGISSRAELEALAADRRPAAVAETIAQLRLE
jgi:phosphoglycolate phosphatase-like HAD superfamily hydrolase